MNPILKMNKKIETYSLISGSLFLISGVAKAIDISVFSNTILQYGFDNLQFIAPLIVLAEVSIGLLLIFQIFQKWSALAGTLLVIIFTIIYIYSFAFHKIEDCGCFGKITVLNTSPVFTLLRNVILIYFLITIWRKSENKLNLNIWIVTTVLIFMCIISFMSGYTYKNNNKKQTHNPITAMEESILKELITTSKDSTYLVYVFTYTCPHCLNSIANLKEYEQSGVVDKVIGLALGDTIAEKNFKEIFNPNFTIHNYSKELLRLTNNFPTAYYVKNDCIAMKISGILPCSFLFKNSHLLSNSNN